MSKQSDRDEFIAIMTGEGMPLSTIRALLRAETTLHRLAELECSSEAADRDRVACPRWTWRMDKGGCLCADYGNFNYQSTGNLWSTDPKHHGDVPRIAVKAARTEHMVEDLINTLTGFRVTFNGDPRGPAILVTVPSGRTNDWGQRGICVP